MTPKGQDASLENEWSDFVKGWIEKHKLSYSSKTTDSGFNSPLSSGPSTPERQSPPSKEEFDRELKQKLVKRRESLEQPNAEPVNLRGIIPKVGNK
ncbi:MAG: hypothetical protein ACR5KX_01150 [Wolbachia sp.]